MKKISFNRFLTFAIIPFLLLLLWLALSLFFASKYSFSVIYSAYGKGDFVSLKTDELLAKQKVSAKFKAKENNLGIISVRFKTFRRINNDKVIFRLKEVGRKDWFYQHTYKVDQFQDNDYFTFGFPIILDSEGKTYYYEIESTKGKKGDAVSISTTPPVFIAQYQFSKQHLFANKTMIPAFFIKKIAYSFSDINFVVSSLVYLLPFIFYIFWCYLARPLIEINFKPYLKVVLRNWSIQLGNYSREKYMLFYIYFIAILILVFFMNVTNNYTYLTLIGSWILLIVIYRFESSVSYLLGLFFLLLCPVLFILNQEAIAENAAIWAYFFLVIGTMETIVELTKNLQNLIGYDVFLKENFTMGSKEKKTVNEKG
jgi:hypothetical protein